MNQPPLSPHSEPDETPERDRHEPPQTPPSAPTEEQVASGTPPATEPEREHAVAEWESLETAAARMRGEEHADEETRAREPAASPPRFPATPPPMPTFGAPQSPPRMAPPPQRPPEQGSYAPPPQRPPEQGSYAPPPTTPPVQEPPPYPPRAPMPQPAPPSSVAEPPRPYEGGRYVPPPPMPASGPAVTAREWTTSTAAPAVQAPAAPVARGNPANTFLLGAIALLLLVLAVFQGINTFQPKATKPTGVQQVQVQQRLKPETIAQVKDTISQTQQALNQYNQQEQQAYASASNDQQRTAILLQLSIFLQAIIAQQNNDLLQIYQDLYGSSGQPSP